MKYVKYILLLFPLLLSLTACGTVTVTELAPEVPAEIVTCRKTEYVSVDIPESTTAREPESETTEPKTEKLTAATTQEPTADETTEPETVYIPLTYGTCGRLDILSVGIGVALYSAPLAEGNAQAVVDDEDSAAFFLWHDCKDVIADHNYQSFKNLPKVNVGDTAVISTADGYKDEYVCVRVCHDGINTGTDFLNESRETVETEPGSLIMYTCNSDWQHVTIVFWKKK